MIGEIDVLTMDELSLKLVPKAILDPSAKPGAPVKAARVRFWSYPFKRSPTEGILGAKWLVNLIGIHYFGHVTTADLSWSSTVNTDFAISTLARVPRLQELNLHASSLSDAELVHLERLTDLFSLNIAGTEVKLSELSLVRTRHRRWRERIKAGIAVCNDHPVTACPANWSAIVRLASAL